VGKETDRRWEQGEDLSLVEFKSFEYQQSKQVVAGEDIKQNILKVGIRKLERDTGVSVSFRQACVTTANSPCYFR
jgi:hypothetical protein